MVHQKALAAAQSLPPRTELSVREVLVAARKLIEKPENWCQHGYALADDDDGTSPLNKRAVKWCMAGACYRAAGRPVHFSDPDAIKLLERITSANWIPDWNDAPDRTHAEVLAAFDKAIAEAA
jgi:hypothetical protein